MMMSTLIPYRLRSFDGLVDKFNTGGNTNQEKSPSVSQRLILFEGSNNSLGPRKETKQNPNYPVEVEVTTHTPGKNLEGSNGSFEHINNMIAEGKIGTIADDQLPPREHDAEETTCDRLLETSHSGSDDLRHPTMIPEEVWFRRRSKWNRKKKAAILATIIFVLIIITLSVYFATRVIDKCLTNGGKGPCTNVCNNVVGSYVCDCLTPGYQLNRDRPSCTPSSDCEEIYKRGQRRSGAYWIHPAFSPRPFLARCELTDGGWTVLMRRYDGSELFYRNWTEYKEGFGAPDAEHWLGNDNIYMLTSQGHYKLRVEFTFMLNCSAYHAEYRHFSIALERDKYKLTISGYSGTSGWDGLSYHDNQSFTTFDKDNDKENWGRNCAELYKGAWWYKTCHMAAHLTGLYPGTCIKSREPLCVNGSSSSCVRRSYCVRGEGTCMMWGTMQPLVAATMKIKPV